MWVTSTYNLKTPPKVNNHLICENSPNLVTLLITHLITTLPLVVVFKLGMQKPVLLLGYQMIMRKKSFYVRPKAPKCTFVGASYVLCPKSVPF
jgi:hypothetical protein